MRDPAVLAVFAVRITAAEHAAILAGRPIVRPFWPTVSCRACVVGLHVAGRSPRRGPAVECHVGPGRVRVDVRAGHHLRPTPAAPCAPWDWEAFT